MTDQYGGRDVGKRRRDAPQFSMAEMENRRLSPAANS